MSKTIRIPNGFLTLVDTDFKCPKCECPHEEKDWFPKYAKSKNGYISIKCKGCKTKLELTTDMLGDVVVWLPYRTPPFPCPDQDPQLPCCYPNCECKPH